MQLKPALIFMALIFTVPACAVNLNVNDRQLLGTEITDEARVVAVIDTQQTAWNAGDIDGFMQGYWQSSELRFASGGTVTHGWQATRDRYHSRYSDRALMGELKFESLEIEILASNAAVVHGAWSLQRELDQPSGLFTLIFRNIAGEWKIVSDTTTSAD